MSADHFAALLPRLSRGATGFGQAFLAEARTKGLVSALELVQASPTEDLATWDQDLYFGPDAGAKAAFDYWRSNMVSDLVRKGVFDAPGLDREGAAIKAFYEAEHRCKITNLRFDPYLSDPLETSREDTQRWEFFLHVKKDIADLLGRLPSRLVPVLTGGATVSDRHTKCSMPDKFQSQPTMYPGTACLLGHWSETAWGRQYTDGPYQPIEVTANVFFTVPKSYKTDRGCCKEASLSLAYQRAVGMSLRDRLRSKWDVNLLSVEKNQRLAREGSIYGTYATVDEKQASDSAARNLVRFLLPELWYELLNSLRAPSTSIDGKIVHLEKFSSMGNGFTFELESVIFAALTRGVLREFGIDDSDFAVYGDDIVVPTAAAHALIQVLQYCGFETNSDKTHVSGPFRESCGGDFYRGHSVSTVKLVEYPSAPEQWIAFHNNLVRVSHDIPERLAYTASLRAYAISQIPSKIRTCWGPRSLGDLCLHGDFNVEMRQVDKTTHHVEGPPERNPPKWKRLGSAPWVPCVRVWRPVFNVLSPVLKDGRDRWRSTAWLAAALNGVESRGVTPRGDAGISGFILDWMPVPPTVVKQTSSYLFCDLLKGQRLE